MGVYDRQIATALRIIKAKGQVVTWFQPVDNADDNPAAPVGLPPVQFPVSIAFFPNNELSLFSTRSMMLNTEVAQGAFYGLMGAQVFTPGLRDWVVTPDGHTYRVKPENGIDTIAPNGQVILHTVRFIE